jgi:hypothetical protein
MPQEHGPKIRLPHILGLRSRAVSVCILPLLAVSLRTWLVGRAILPQPLPERGPMIRDLVEFLLTPRALVPGFWGLPLNSGASSNGGFVQDLPPVMSER